MMMETKKVMMKFQEERIIYQKFSLGRKKGNGDTPIPTKKNCWLWGVPNYLAIFPEGEDENTMTNLSQRLQNEAKITKDRRNNNQNNGLNICRTKEDGCKGSC